MKKITAFITGVLALILSGCAAAGPLESVQNSSGIMHTTSLFAMDTVMELQAYGNEEVLTEAEAFIRDIEKKISVTDPDSEISHLNSDGQAQLSDDTVDLLERALNICAQTEGALDISIYPVLRAWGFTTGNYQVPPEKELSDLLKNVDYRNIELTGNTATISNGMQIDLGSVTKGYTSNMITEYFRQQGITSALINLGGNVQCIGTKPNGDKWKVAIKSPFKDSKTGVFAVVEAADRAIITSGGYERFFEEDGETYWHILDPKTGRPAQNGLISVTIIGEDGLVCDGLSTALFVKGLDGAIDYWRSHDDFDAVFITDDGNVYVTQGIENSFSLTTEYREHEIHVLSK